MTVIEPKIEADATSASPLGDDYDPVAGTVTFSATDISLPGNFDIPVELSRWAPNDDVDTGGLVAPGWKWNLPFIRGNYLDVKTGHSDTGWDWGYNTWRHGKNCSGSADTVINNNGDAIAGNAYWQGKLLHIPGVTSETFLNKANGDQVTKSNFKIVGCIENPDGQQGIVVAGPNGLTYTFNQIKSYYNGKAALKDPIVRTRLLLVTKIEDRFGNRVDYTYINGQLSQISATDGRLITLGGGGASAHGRTWTYASTASNGLLVTRPDGSQWKYEGVSSLAFKPNGIGGYGQQFRIPPAGSGQGPLIPGCSTATGDYTVTVNSPGGLLSTYVFRDTVHYRSNVDPELYVDMYDPFMEISRTLHCTVARSLVSKTLSGPGIATANWTYQYSSNRGTYTAESGINGYLTGPFNLPAPVGGYPSPYAAGTAVDLRSTTITGPDKKLVFYIDRKFQSISESRVIAQDVLNTAGTQLFQRMESTFSLGDYVGMHWYMCPCEGTPPVNENQLSARINQTQSVLKRYVTGGSDIFTTTSSNFDAYGFTLTTQGSNNFSANVRTVQTTYLHDTVNGLIGLPLTETVNGLLASEHHYNAQGQRDWTKAFGKLQASVTYDTTSTVASGQRGTLKTVKDGNNNTSTFTNWKRGIPQTALYADSTTRAAVVNDSGWITSVTDEVAAKTCYTYDAMGRIGGITYPSETSNGVCDTSKWSPMVRSFVPVASVEYGIPAGHWRETVTIGNAVKIGYYDAMWRPLLVREYDASNMAGTQRVTKTAYDAEGRVSFAAYPMASVTYAAQQAGDKGVTTFYDPLGRVTSASQDSELGLLTSLTTYNPGFTTTLTNPRGFSTTSTYLAYDQPITDWPLVINAPESATTTIVRDGFGKPTSLTRSGGGVTPVVRSYAYNSYQELCRTVEPETGATLFGYDAAGNLTWSAAGLASSQACHATGNTTAINARKASRTYDNRNRMLTLAFPGGNGNQTWTYTPDGLPSTVSTNNSGNAVTNAYVYNKRRLMSGESMNPDTVQLGWGMGYGYNALGQVVSEAYPASVAVNYTVNALGQTSQVTASADGGAATTIASGASYFPNGALKQFTYGNGIVHTMTQNARQLPSQSVDGTVLNLTTTFDANGNVSAITDGTAAARQTRSMVYDQLDRLTSTTSPMFGTASYVYDTLDNLRQVNVSGGTGARNHYYCYNAANQLTFVRSGSNCSSSPAVVNISYDVQGNLLQKTGTTGGTYTFDYGNRLRTVVAPSAPMQTYNYRYDADGRRVRQDVSGGSLKYSYYAKDGRVVWQRDEPSSKRISNVYLAGSLVAEYTRPIGAGTATISYLHTDALGSPIAKTNSSGTVIETSEYEPYGDLLNRANDDRAGYTGHVMDAASGLTYMQQRYYDPQIGRFLSVDPVTAYSSPVAMFNRYRYANSNPYRYYDPDGRCTGSRDTDDGTCRSTGGGTTQSSSTNRPQMNFFADGRQTWSSWPVPGHTKINTADKPREGRGEFGTPRSTSRGASTHTGIDAEAPTGARVVAIREGTVVDINPNPSETYGNQVVIDHGDQLFSQSAHLDTVLVKPGDKVNRDQTIGTVGRTGNTPRLGDTHLHFEIRLRGPAPKAAGGAVVDPLPYLPGP